jgi:hypothetical protein
MRRTPEDYPNPRRSINYDEVMEYVDQLTEIAREWKPTQIIGVARSGMPYATWVAQALGLDLGMYNPKFDQLCVVPINKSGPNRFMVIDETFERGNTQAKIKEAFDINIQRRNLFFINSQVLIASVFVDHFHPYKNDCCYVKELDFWCDGIAGVNKKISVEEPHWRNQ